MMLKLYNISCNLLRIAHIFLIFMIVYMGVGFLENYFLILILILNGARMQTNNEKRLMLAVSIFTAVVFGLLTGVVIYKGVYMAIPVTASMMLISLGPVFIDLKKLKG